MSKYPVTQEQWEAIMGNNPSRFSMYKYDPVENVSWDDAVGFCKKLSEKTGKKYRLPTEAEWEYACRAGTTTPFYFGETITPDLVEYDIRYRRTFFPGRYIGRYEVVILPPNPFGLYDMHGNIWEWCQDWYGDYPTGAVTNPSGPSFGSYRVIRGGTFCNNKACRSADRGSMILFDFLLHYVGFRLALSQVSK